MCSSSAIDGRLPLGNAERNGPCRATEGLSSGTGEAFFWHAREQGGSELSFLTLSAALAVLRGEAPHRSVGKIVHLLQVGFAGEVIVASMTQLLVPNSAERWSARMLHPRLRGVRRVQKVPDRLLGRQTVQANARGESGD